LRLDFRAGEGRPAEYPRAYAFQRTQGRLGSGQFEPHCFDPCLVQRRRKNDPVGRSGFAHLFEHLMFKSTRNMPNEKMDRLTEDVGGFNNASTWPDYTNYYEVVPSNHLETLLWAESDRMANLKRQRGELSLRTEGSSRGVSDSHTRSAVRSGSIGTSTM
jgi:hypothetical protein